MRGAFYSAAFLARDAACWGWSRSWWALLALPAAVLIGFAFAAVGMACTTFMQSWQDFEYVTLAQLPMFLFSATFYPLSVYPESLQWVVRCSPLYHAADAAAGAHDRHRRPGRRSCTSRCSPASAWSACWSPAAGWRSCC